MNVKKAIAAVVLVICGLLVPARPAAAGFYCSAYSYYALRPRLVCRVTCVYCEDMFGNQVSEYCSEVCWERSI